MEAVAWMAGEPHSDAPACACPVVASAVRSLNDRMPDNATRTRFLRPVLKSLIGSRSTLEVEVARGLVAADFAVRVFAPLALEACGQLEHAKALRECPPIKDASSAEHGKMLANRASASAYASAYASASARASAVVWKEAVRMLRAMLAVKAVSL